MTAIRRILAFLAPDLPPRDIDILVRDTKGACLICGDKLPKPPAQGRPKVCCKTPECRAAYHRIRQAARRRELAKQKECP
jgi:hypothetical protein